LIRKNTLVAKINHWWQKKKQWWTTWKILVVPKKTTGELKKPLVAEKTIGEPLENHW